MFIKANIRGGYRQAAKYLAAQGENESTKLVHISDPDARNLDEAFHNMWQTASATKAEKPLFHFSINPFKDERLTRKQVDRIAEAYAAKCNMDIRHHQHVIVEHVKDGRQHFHVVMNRVSEKTGKAIDPGLFKKKAKECSREMEKELGLRVLVPKKGGGRSKTVRIKPTKTKPAKFPKPMIIRPMPRPEPPREAFRRAVVGMKRRRPEENKPFRPVIDTAKQEYFDLLEWAWFNRRIDILVQFGILLPPDFFEL